MSVPSSLQIAEAVHFTYIDHESGLVFGWGAGLNDGIRVTTIKGSRLVATLPLAPEPSGVIHAFLLGRLGGFWEGKGVAIADTPTGPVGDPS